MAFSSNTASFSQILQSQITIKITLLEEILFKQWHFRKTPPGQV